jgi:hypothetical protein
LRQLKGILVGTDPKGSAARTKLNHHFDLLGRTGAVSSWFLVLEDFLCKL